MDLKSNRIRFVSLIRPGYMIAATSVIALILIVSAVFELSESKKEIYKLMTEEAVSLVETVKMSSSNTVLSNEEIEDLMGSASYEYRKYGNRPALGLDQSVKAGERIDNETVLGFSLEKDFRVFGVRFYYILVDNSSNDEHYNFKNNIFGLGINSGF